MTEIRKSPEPRPLTPKDWEMPPGLGRAVVLGCLIGGIAAWVAVTAGMRIEGLEWASALGLGAFAGFWGGIGFGAMMGGSVYLSAEKGAGKGPTKGPEEDPGRSPGDDVAPDHAAAGRALGGGTGARPATDQASSASV